MIELHDAVAATARLTNGYLVGWAPGDATLYHVALINTAVDDDAPERLYALLVMQPTHRPHLLIQGPRADYDHWNVERFYRAFGDDYAGWWAGVRPLLAALDWTTNDDRDLVYGPGDAVEIAVIADRLRS